MAAIHRSIHQFARSVPMLHRRRVPTRLAAGAAVLAMAATAQAAGTQVMVSIV